MSDESAKPTSSTLLRTKISSRTVFCLSTAGVFQAGKSSDRKLSFHDLSFIVDGKGSYFVNDREYKVKAGDTIYIPPGSIREAYSSQSEPLHTYAFNFYLLPDKRRSPSLRRCHRTQHHQ